MKTEQLKDMTAEIQPMVESWKAGDIKSVLEQNNVPTAGFSKKAELVDLYLKMRTREFKSDEEIIEQAGRIWDHTIAGVERTINNASERNAELLEKAIKSDSELSYMLRTHVEEMYKNQVLKELLGDVVGWLKDARLLHMNSEKPVTLEVALTALRRRVEHEQEQMMCSVASGSRSTKRDDAILEIFKNETVCECLKKVQQAIEVLTHQRELHMLPEVYAGRGYEIWDIKAWFKHEDYLMKNGCAREIHWCRKCGKGISDNGGGNHDC